MEKQAGSIITFVLLALTFCCWLTALVAPGWFLFEFKTSSSSSPTANAPLGQSSKKSFTNTTEVDMGLFFIHVCTNDVCLQIDYEELKSMKHYQALPELIELQVEGVLAMALCTISGLLVMIPDRSKSRIFRVASSLMSTAVILESILIYRTASASMKINDAWDEVKQMEQEVFADTSLEVKSSYSILIAGFGTLFGILGCVSSFAMYRKSRHCAQQDQVLNVFHAAPTTGYRILQETM